ncbi:FAD-dependent oxidoreductase [Fonticella tunisiensis]|uniref:2,4-dienoyl-CoA reductase-like NADH-dependent reductase (Old Yellow Enzyme family) n=1 Tax=Fonticella tunisiensis TaxID=1096341 RepID=A0A4R7KT53_9CLOT|nr:FAD-dependent oxidoreductase [Fonticella tunisiensis]TDT63257.1 2,4-dienoyl-CoA reductase-like NADH-dependent reductase (Old Yellow Enzyme family) [Fonticella tunisiensis]
MSVKTLNSSPVFAPISIGSIKLKNRLVVSPMVTVFCDPDGFATEQYIAYHEAKAKGGWGLIITEDYAVDPLGRGFWTAGLWKDEQMEGHARLTQRVHQHGAKIVAQIYHAGRQASYDVIGQQPVSASPIPCPVMGYIPRELTIPEIKKIVSEFGDAALRAKKCGFDGVEVHGAHGYLIAQFMSTYSNKRCDEYGGPIENRMRFPLEIIADIRKKCGKDFTVIFRISGDEYVPGGRTIEETKLIAAMLEKAGVDAIHVSAGVYGSTWAVIPPLNVTNGWIVNLAEEVKRVVNIPVITVGRINDPRMAETILASGKADLVAMGRASLADPELPNKFAEGRYDDIRHCIGCQQGCLARLFNNEPIRCVVNPTLGFEYLNETKKAKTPKKVTVVGGGLAGMEAARAAALAGHNVTLYEKSDKLGGQFGLAPIPPFKGNMAYLPSWLARQIKKLGINIKLNTEYTPAVCDEEKPDVVIIATGSTPSKPPIPGIDGSNVVFAQDALAGKVTVKGKVLVAGGGMIGCETATHFAMQGKQVAIVELLPEIATDEESTRREFLLNFIEQKKIQVMKGTKVVEINEKGARLEKDGEIFDFDADTIILALGVKPNSSLAKELEGKTEVKVIGDALKIRNALDAVREGFLAGMNA